MVYECKDRARGLSESDMRDIENLLENARSLQIQEEKIKIQLALMERVVRYFFNEREKYQLVLTK